MFFQKIEEHFKQVECPLGYKQLFGFVFFILRRFIHLFHGYLLILLHVPDTMLGVEDKVLNEAKYDLRYTHFCVCGESRHAININK